MNSLVIESFPDDDPDVLTEVEMCSYCINSVISSSLVLERIREIFRTLYSQFEQSIANNSFQNESISDVSLPLKKSSNPDDSQINPIFGIRIQFLSSKPKSISFVRQHHRFAIILRTLEIIYLTLLNGELISKRSLFYHDISLYRNYKTVCDVIEDISSLLEVPRSALGIISCPRGFVCGPLRWVDTNGNETDCRHSSVTIPPRSDAISIVKTSAVAILVVEKDTVFMRLSQTTIVNEVIIITGRGVPDYSTREFVKLLEDTLSIPIVGLFDGDAYGIFIMTIYRFGSRSAAFDGMGLATSRMKWGGIRPSEIGDMFEGKKKDISEKEKVVLEKLMEEKFLPNDIKREICILLEKGKSIEIEALLGFGNDNYLVDSYLPNKFALKDWI